LDPRRRARRNVLALHRRMGGQGGCNAAGMPVRLVSPAPRATWLDALLASVVLASGVWAWMSRPTGEGSRAVAYVDGREAAWWNLSGRVVRDTLEGAIGSVVVEHGSGSVRIVQAPCPHQICVKAGAARSVHSQIACVPSHLVLVVEGQEGNGGLDAIP